MSDETRRLNDSVTPEQFARSYAVPSTWVITFGWGRDWWFSQENGLCTEPGTRPDIEDIERMLTA